MGFCIISGLLLALLVWPVRAAETQLLHLTGLGKDDGVAWDFYCSGGRNSGYWTNIAVPSCWELQGFGTYNYGNAASPSAEQGIYRRTFGVPVEWFGRKVDLVFEGAMTDTSVTVNSNSAGPIHQGGFTEFRYDVSSLLNYGSSNLIEVTVAKRSANTSINQAEREADYWIFGGIYRPVYLSARPSESIERSALNPLANGILTGLVRLAGIAQSADLVATLRTTNGTLVGTLPAIALVAGQTNANLAGNFAGVQPWSMENPVLYDLTLELIRSGIVLHTVTERIGFRTVQVHPGDGLYLNGAKIRLKGVNRHTFWPDSGRTSSAALSAQAVSLIKGMNMNAVRMSHYPPDKHFLDECDARGLLVINELPGWQSPAYDNSVAPRLVRELVERDVNRPCVVLWANGNEGGWNTSVDDDFAQHDPQARAVIHPSSNYGGDLVQGGFDTTHYPTYATLTSKLAGNNLFLPTEFLHGLYDGGHGAGLQDYWNAMRASSKGVGGFLWVFADEGLVRTDLNNTIDTDGNHAPDGIVGPYLQKEPSYEAIRQIWSPVVVTTPPTFNTAPTVSVGLLNDYHFNNLSQCSFRWELVDFPKLGQIGTNGVMVSSSGEMSGPAVAPQGSGSLLISLPENWAQRDVLRLTAFGPGGEALRSWIWPIRSRAALVSDNLPAASGNATVEDGGSTWLLSGGSTQVAVSKTTGLIAYVLADGTPIGLTNGPRIVAGNSSLTSISTRHEGAQAVVETVHSGNLSNVLYRMHPSGALEISYAFPLNGNFSNIGLTFDFPSSSVTGFRWLGDGSQPVWRNRLAGGSLAVWQKSANDAIPGQAWTEDPVFRGNHGNFIWGSVQSTNATVSFLTDTAGLFFRLLTPSPGASPQQATFTMPPGELSLLHGISAHGNKFHAAASTGPSGGLNAASGSYTGRFFLVFDAVALPPRASNASAQSPFRVRINYTKAMGTSAFDPAKYSFSPPRAVHAVIPDPPTAVLLEVQPLTPSTDYTLTISHTVSDTLGALLAGTNQFPLTYVSGIVAHWPFDSATNGSSPDLSGNIHNASLIGNASIVDGRITRALNVTGTSGAGALFWSPSLSRFTVSAWVRADSSGISSFPRLVSFGDDNIHWFLDYSSGNNRSIGLNAKGKGDWRTTAGILPPFGNWMHVAVAYDSAGDAPAFYLNGVPQAIASAAASSGSYETVGTSGIGNRITDEARPFSGAIDELRIHDRLLSTEEIASLAARPPTQTYAEWIAPFAAPDPSPLGDSDLDGIPNAFERLFSSSPVVATASADTTRAWVENASFKFTYPVPDSFEGEPPLVEVSQQLTAGSWIPVPADQVSVWRVHGDRVEFCVERPLSVGGREFLRLKLP